MKLSQLGNKDSVKRKASKNEASFAKRNGGWATPLSGATSKYKSDVMFKKVRVEHKETDKESITIKLSWLRKLLNETQLSEVPALALKIQDQTWVMVRESEFAYILERVNDKES